MLIFNYSQDYIFTSATVSSHPPDLSVIPHLWNSSCIIYRFKKRNVVTLSWNNNSAMKYELSRNDSVLWNLKFNSNIHFQTTSHRDLSVIYHLWWCTYVQAMYTGQPPSGDKTSKHCPIDVPFFFPVRLLSEVNLKQHAVESGVTVDVTLMHYKAREVTSL